MSFSIYFYDMSSGLGESNFFVYYIPWATYRAALASTSASSDDASAIASLPMGTTNPVDGGAYISVKPPNGRAIGLNTPDIQFSGAPCPGFTGIGCVGINTTLANSIGDITSVVQHEVDELLALGSGLSSGFVSTYAWPEDLFRYASAGVRSYALNPGTNVGCTLMNPGAVPVVTPRAFLSADGGVTNINEFNNCNNGGDYGDWITHTPSQIQDAFTNGSGTPSLTAGLTEVRALDILGYTLATVATKAAMTSPANGSMLSGPSASTFNGPRARGHSTRCTSERRRAPLTSTR